MSKTVYLQARPLFVSLIICGFILTSCNQKEGNHNASGSGINKDELGINLPAMYTGTLPCADCPGIRYNLIIDENSFTEISIYDNDPNARFEKDGKWEINGDTLSIFDSEKFPIKRFLINEKTLILLDRDHQEITEDLAGMYVLERSGNQPSIREHHKKLADQGIRFFAGGNEPFWSVKMDSLNNLMFETPDSTKRFSEVDPTNDGNQVILKGTSDSGQITIQITKNYCQDSMSGYLFHRTVVVVLEPARNDTLTGCGLFLNS